MRRIIQIPARELVLAALRNAKVDSPETKVDTCDFHIDLTPDSVSVFIDTERQSGAQKG